jgi:hypothetical protein
VRVNAVTRGIGLGLLASILIFACAQAPHRTVERAGSKEPQLTPEMLQDWRKRNEIDQLWIQIRDWRHEEKMEIDPPQQLQQQFRTKNVKEARRVCPDDNPPPKTVKCNDTCMLADAICGNATRICELADQLGKNDPAQEKCASAKASCREAKQRCCDCKPDLTKP